MIRPACQADAQAICDIYNIHINETIVTFETVPVSTSTMSKRIRHVQLNHPWIVYEEDGEIRAYAYATTWKTREAYQRSVESTIYVKESAQRNGLGFLLYMHLLNLLKQQGVHAVIGGISLPNIASITLHEKCGFVKIGQFKEVGYKLNRWIDVGYWERILDV